MLTANITNAAFLTDGARLVAHAGPGKQYLTGLIGRVTVIERALKDHGGLETVVAMLDHRFSGCHAKQTPETG